LVLSYVIKARRARNDNAQHPRMYAGTTGDPMTHTPRSTHGLLVNLVGLAVAAAVGSAAYAQTEQPASRADVKAQTKAANKAGQMVPGEEDPSIKQPAPKSTKNRADTKAETKAANKEGTLGSSSGSMYKSHNVAPREQLSKSTKTRAEGKAETKQAVKEHKTPPAGEAAAPSK
jgi:hypothetical protein